MNAFRTSLDAVARILPRTIGRPAPARPRRFRPLAEPMEARALLSQFLPAPVSTDAPPVDCRPADTVGGNGQVENQPG